MGKNSSAVSDRASDRSSEVLVPFLCLDKPLVERSPHPECQLCAIVPVRNEAELLPQTLSSLFNQVDLTGQPLPKDLYEVIVLANNCTDESAEIARNFGMMHPDFALHVVEITLPPAEAYIGRVRQILMDEACSRLVSIDRLRGVIASTDGDTRVSATWVAATLAEIGRGADAVGGKILTEKAERAALEPYTRKCFLQGAGYYSLIVELEAYIDGDPFDTLPRHNHNYGASLAVTVEMYRKVGGMPAVRTPEDVAFYKALIRANAHFRHSLAVKVTTAVRQSGRTALGFANQLCVWSEMGRKQQYFLVEPAVAVETRLQTRAKLRQIWQRYLRGYIPKNLDLGRVAMNLGIDTDWLRDSIVKSWTFNGLWFDIEERQRLEGIWQHRWGLVPIQQAIADLRVRVASLRQQSQSPVLVVDKRSHQGDSAERYVAEQNTDAIRYALQTRSPEAIWGKGA